MQKIAVGGENFVALRESDSYYVDKTEILQKLIDANNSVTLFTRPRRFGKTLMINMIESFFSLFKKQDVWAFEGLNVMKHADFCEKYMNQYPVLSISLKDVEGLNFESAYAMLKAKISDLFVKFSSLEVGSKTFHNLLHKEANYEEVKNSLQTLSRMLHEVYGKKVIILIDEYDVPLAKAHANGYYCEMLDVIRGFMSVALKSNEFLEFAVVTGCLRIPKESIFTGVNNFASYSVIDKRFAEYFGFTPQEVNTMLKAFGRSDKMGLVREWYDGYLFGNTEIFCPWDVVNYVSELRVDEDARPKNYWNNTSSNDAIKKFFELEDVEISGSLEALLNGGSITATITDQLTYEGAYSTLANLWSVLLMTGYITPTRQIDDTAIELRIPNKEIAGIFQTAVVDHFNQTADKTQIQALMNALWAGDTEKASEILSDLLWKTISYMDYHENYYHAFMAGIFVGRGYEVMSNKESGLGRPDIDLRDRKNRRAIIIEAKKAATESEMELKCREALRQISEQAYGKDLYGYREVLCYGIAFYKKQALVMKLE